MKQKKRANLASTLTEILTGWQKIKENIESNINEATLFIEVEGETNAEVNKKRQEKLETISVLLGDYEKEYSKIIELNNQQIEQLNKTIREIEEEKEQNLQKRKNAIQELLAKIPVHKKTTEAKHGEFNAGKDAYMSKRKEVLKSLEFEGNTIDKLKKELVIKDEKENEQNLNMGADPCEVLAAEIQKSFESLGELYKDYDKFLKNAEGLKDYEFNKSQEELYLQVAEADKQIENKITEYNKLRDTIIKQEEEQLQSYTTRINDLKDQVKQKKDSFENQKSKISEELEKFKKQYSELIASFTSSLSNFNDQKISLKQEYLTITNKELEDDGSNLRSYKSEEYSNCKESVENNIAELEEILQDEAINITKISEKQKKIGELLCNARGSHSLLKNIVTDIKKTYDEFISRLEKRIEEAKEADRKQKELEAFRKKLLGEIEEKIENCININKQELEKKWILIDEKFAKSNLELRGIVEKYQKIINTDKLPIDSLITESDEENVLKELFDVANGVYNKLCGLYKEIVESVSQIKQKVESTPTLVELESLKKNSKEMEEDLKRGKILSVKLDEELIKIDKEKDVMIKKLNIKLDDDLKNRKKRSELEKLISDYSDKVAGFSIYGDCKLSWFTELKKLKDRLDEESFDRIGTKESISHFDSVYNKMRKIYLDKMKMNEKFPAAFNVAMNIIEKNYDNMKFEWYSINYLDQIYDDSIFRFGEYLIRIYNVPHKVSDKDSYKQRMYDYNNKCNKANNIVQAQFTDCKAAVLSEVDESAKVDFMIDSSKIFSKSEISEKSYF